MKKKIEESNINLGNTKKYVIRESACYYTRLTEETITPPPTRNSGQNRLVIILAAVTLGEDYQ